MSKPVFFTVADDNNRKFAEMMEHSLKKFHPDIPLIVYGQKELDAIPDPQKFYKMTPLVGRLLLHEYNPVIKLDCDQVITGSLSHVIEDETYDVGVVLNSNPREVKKFVVQVWDINPFIYYNCGFVAMRSLEFVEHWWKLCMSQHFPVYQYREQDFLNILCHYGNYNVKCFDYSDKFHGLASSSYWNHIELKEGKLILPPQPDGFPDSEKEIRVLHFAGGQQNNANKMRFDGQFTPEVAKHLKGLVSNGEPKKG